jgi:hypothetical protein
MNWTTLYEKILPYIVSIETPNGAGTGFLFAYNEDKTIVAFATAAHVVKHEDDWKLPIKLRHFKTGKEITVTDEDRVIFVHSKLDSASILLFSEPSIRFPLTTLPLMDPKKFLHIGSEVGWVGFPYLAESNLCFFSGPISARLKDDNSYLIDGVAINGVSGGPVFYSSKDSDGHEIPKIIGTVSSYLWNTQLEGNLPGLMKIQDVTAFHGYISFIKSMDEARKKKAEQKRKQSR